MNFDNKFTEDWGSTGTEPSADLKTNGFQGGYKPPAGVFNWFWSKVIKCITELQTKLTGEETARTTAIAEEATARETADNLKVDKVTGKGLSTEDYTTAEKTKLSGIETNATAVGKVDEEQGETRGEIFNSYSGKYKNSAFGDCSHAEGKSAAAGGECSHAEGIGTLANGDYSHAEGYSTKSSGIKSHAEGEDTTASGCQSHAEGGDTTASGDWSHAEGYSTLASGECSHAGGGHTEARDRQTVVGRYNKVSDGPTLTGMTGDLFIIGNGTSYTAKGNAFRVTTAGKAYGLSAFAGSGADYAEYFEWKDGNVNNEDRRGYFVTLDGDKIKIASSNDDYILGVVSATPVIEGDIQSEQWCEMYLKDIFGNKLIETVEVEETTDENGKVIPAHKESRWVLNPEYDSSKQYVSRDKRKEWSAIGMLGKLVVIDDGTCQVNGYCKVSDNGTATASDTGYRVISRLDENHIKILCK